MLSLIDWTFLCLSNSPPKIKIKSQIWYKWMVALSIKSLSDHSDFRCISTALSKGVPLTWISIWERGQKSRKEIIASTAVMIEDGVAVAFMKAPQLILFSSNVSPWMPQHVTVESQADSGTMKDKLRVHNPVNYTHTQILACLLLCIWPPDLTVLFCVHIVDSSPHL